MLTPEVPDGGSIRAKLVRELVKGIRRLALGKHTPVQARKCILRLQQESPCPAAGTFKCHKGTVQIFRGGLAARASRSAQVPSTDMKGFSVTKNASLPRQKNNMSLAYLIGSLRRHHVAGRLLSRASRLLPSQLLRFISSCASIVLGGIKLRLQLSKLLHRVIPLASSLRQGLCSKHKFTTITTEGLE